MRDFSRENIIEAAQMIIQMNTAYCKQIGDPEPKRWEEHTEQEKEDMIKGIHRRLFNPTSSLSASHQDWMAVRLAQGWSYGETKNEVDKKHPNLVPYNELPKAQQFKARLFVTVVLQFFGATELIKYIEE